MPRTQPFDEHPGVYEAWFHRHADIYGTELEALRRFMPAGGRGIEIGAGSGRFALRLGIRWGVEPSLVMARIARYRGMAIVRGVAEDLPIAAAAFDHALIVTTLCFVDDPTRALREVARILRPGGRLLLGFVDRASPLGRSYERRREQSLFYRAATFLAAPDVLYLLHDAGFRSSEIFQTVFGDRDDLEGDQTAIPGHGDGGFVVVHALRSAE
ncbi:MAG: methyltransferase domain-containing protein [Candidatus Eisenbacteria bacterium]|nr:methyltransferase domain-containing protein [Candidatus Eisenbacteria bacterium]